MKWLLGSVNTEVLVSETVAAIGQQDMTPADCEALQNKVHQKYKTPKVAQNGTVALGAQGFERAPALRKFAPT